MTVVRAFLIVGYLALSFAIPAGAVECQVSAPFTLTGGDEGRYLVTAIMPRQTLLEYNVEKRLDFVKNKAEFVITSAVRMYPLPPPSLFNAEANVYFGPLCDKGNHPNMAAVFYQNIQASDCTNAPTYLVNIVKVTSNLKCN